MTVSTDLNRKQYAGNGSTTSFATSPVVFFETSDLDVYVVTTATGAATLLTENTHYTVSGGAGSTGTVSLAGGSDPYGAPSASQTLVIVRNVPLTQEVDFVQNDSSDAEVQEDALDKLTMADQQLSARLDRSFTLADSDVSGASLTVPTPEANLLVGWNSSADGLENKVPADLDLATVTTFIETLLDDATAAEARTTLGASATTPADDVFRVVGSSDPTKKVAFEVDGLTTATTRTITVADKSFTIGKAPTRTVLTSGSSATYTTPTGATRINVRMVGGGGGGGAADTNSGTAGNDTTFGSLTASGGAAGVSGQAAGGNGGAASGGDINIPGGSGGGGQGATSGKGAGGNGGSSAFGGGGKGGHANASGGNGATNSGGGGGGGSNNDAGGSAGSGGGAGGYVEKLIPSPAATYTYTVGAAANGGTAGSQAGGNGAAGIIIVDEFYD